MKALTDSEGDKIFEVEYIGAIQTVSCPTKNVGKLLRLAQHAALADVKVRVPDKVKEGTKVFTFEEFKRSVFEVFLKY